MHRLGHPSLGTCTTQRSPPTKVAGYRTGTSFGKSGQQRRVLATTSYNNCNRSIIEHIPHPLPQGGYFFKRHTLPPPTPYPPVPLTPCDLSITWSQSVPHIYFIDNRKSHSIRTGRAVLLLPSEYITLLVYIIYMHGPPNNRQLHHTTITIPNYQLDS